MDSRNRAWPLLVIGVLWLAGGVAAAIIVLRGHWTLALLVALAAVLVGATYAIAARSLVPAREVNNSLKRARPMLAIGLLLLDAGITALQARPYELGLLGGGREDGVRAGVLLIGTAAGLQIALAAALWLRLRWAPILAVIALALSLGLVLLVLAAQGPVAVLMNARGYPGGVSPETPLYWLTIATVAVGATLVYAVAIRSLLPAGRLSDPQTPARDEPPADVMV